jgi:hypothetical protein
MGYKIETNKEILEKHYSHWRETGDVEEEKLDPNYQKMRSFLVSTYDKLKNEGRTTYQIDLPLALSFYTFLNDQPDFAPIYESDYDFWKYIAVYMIPDIVADRHGGDNKAYFYASADKIYPFALYWYVHLSWQGSVEETEKILHRFSTDEILQLVGRPGKLGVSLELFRKMMKRFSTVPKDKWSYVVNGSKQTIVRLILIKNTGKLAVLRPEVYPGGIDGYLDMLFSDYQI